MGEEGEGVWELLAEGERVKELWGGEGVQPYNCMFNHNKSNRGDRWRQAWHDDFVTF